MDVVVFEDRPTGAQRGASLEPYAGGNSAVAKLPTAEAKPSNPLEVHARRLAQEHRISERPVGDSLLARFEENARVLRAAYEELNHGTHSASDEPAAAWLLDNFYLVREQVNMARSHLPHKYSLELPQLAGGEVNGLPRVFDLALGLIGRVDGHLDPESIESFLSGYQSVTALRIGELWAIPIMLRLALIENLRRVGERIAAKPQPAAAPAAESNGAAADGQDDDLRTMRNSITSIRALGALDWKTIVENQSALDRILRDDPVGIYAHMSFSSRDRYRHAVERLARKAGLPEEVVARKAIAAAKSAGERVPGSEHEQSATLGHVGYYLFSSGRSLLEIACGYRPGRLDAAREIAVRSPLACYLGATAIVWGLTVGVAAAVAWQLGAARLGAWLGFALAALFAGAAGQFATTLVNWLSTLIVAPQSMLRLDFSAGIPRDCRTLVAVPTMLTSETAVAAMIDQLEVRYLANKDDNLQFALVTDFTDANGPNTPADGQLIAQARSGIDALNRIYSLDGPTKFYLLHRPRKWEPQEGVWMGEERKRGKLAALNQLLLRGERSEFSEIAGEIPDLAGIRYVITLDADTRLPRDAARQMIACMAHPLNRARLDPVTKVVRSGYGILQPRITTMLPDANRSWYSRLLSGDAGIDPYTRQTSNVYQDLFGEGSFIGKGIYDVAAFDAALEGRMPEHRVLSHDLIEGCFARSGLINDVELFEGYPSKLLADMSRRYRWIRGDWQIAAWLFPWVPGGRGRRRNPLSWLSSWKIFDNLARSLVPVCLLTFLLIGWSLPPLLAAWCTLAALLTLLGPTLICSLPGFFKKPEEKPWSLQFLNHFQTCLRNMAGEALALAVLPNTVHCNIDAILRTLYRLVVSQRKLLEWTTASEAEIRCAKDLRGHYKLMWSCTAIGAGMAALLAIENPLALLIAAPVLLGWLAGPGIAWRISQSRDVASAPLSSDAMNDFGRWARQTWHYYETHLGPRDHWLPPDNVQEHPQQIIASRTSPTNVGMSLVADLAACDLGYLAASGLLERVGHTVDTLDRLERYRGHWFNWYDTRTLQPIEPRYVSTVDSGNLWASLLVLQAGLEELAGRPIVAPRLGPGIDDTLRAISAIRKQQSAAVPDRGIDTVFSLLDEARSRQPQSSASATLRWLAEMETLTAPFAGAAASEGPVVNEWLANLHQQIGTVHEELSRLTFWKSTAAPIRALLQTGQLDPRIRTKPLAELIATIEAGDGSCTLREIPPLARETAAGTRAVLAQMSELGGRRDPTIDALRALLVGLAEAAATAADYAEELLAQASSLARWCEELDTADFSFLFHRGRGLLAIGLNASEDRRDNSFYDLLASESRLTSFLAVSHGQLPQSHWFTLGRMVTLVDGEPSLLSWSASMFEYLMPMLFMPSYPGTLLDESCRTAVRRQIRYAAQHQMPWGISESCYNIVDAAGVYQYRAFGVPGLGLERGIGKHRVIAPYATALAAMLMPKEAWENLALMERLGYLGPHGFYDAIDYTPERLNQGQPVVCRSVMAHHSGMALLAFTNVLLGRPMEKRFLREPTCRAHDLLLHERAPQAIRPIDPRAATDTSQQKPRVARRVAAKA